jgi:hypothetical protein
LVLSAAGFDTAAEAREAKKQLQEQVDAQETEPEFAGIDGGRRPFERQRVLFRGVNGAIAPITNRIPCHLG